MNDAKESRLTVTVVANGYLIEPYQSDSSLSLVANHQIYIAKDIQEMARIMDRLFGKPKKEQ